MQFSERTMVAIVALVLLVWLGTLGILVGYT